MGENVVAFAGGAFESGSVFDQELDEGERASATEGMMEDVFVLGFFVRVGTVFEQDFDGLDAVVVEGAFEGVGVFGLGVVLEEDSEAVGIGRLGGVVERLVVVDIGSVLDEEFGEFGVVFDAAGSVEGGERIALPVGVFVGGVGVGTSFEKESGGGDGVLGFEV